MYLTIFWLWDQTRLETLWRQVFLIFLCSCIGQIKCASFKFDRQIPLPIYKINLPFTSVYLSLFSCIDTQLFSKLCMQKKLKLRELQRTSICFRKRNLTREEEIDILMGLIDLKVVSRVLRMAEITQEQLHWCDQKMGKLRLLEGKLQRDSSPLFFPAHWPT